MPIPPRFWWLKRLLALGVILLLGLIGVRLWWGWDAKRRLQAEIDKLIAAGEPIYPEDFDPEPVPDDQNAAKLLLDAEKAIVLTPEERRRRWLNPTLRCLMCFRSFHSVGSAR